MTMQKTEFNKQKPQREQPATQASGECCATCRFARNNGTEASPGNTPFTCHRRPPVAQAVLAPNGQGGIARAGSISTFPPVDPDEWCGEWAPAPGALQ